MLNDESYGHIVYKITREADEADQFLRFCVIKVGQTIFATGQPFRAYAELASRQEEEKPIHLVAEFLAVPTLTLVKTILLSPPDETTYAILKEYQ